MQKHFTPTIEKTLCSARAKKQAGKAIHAVALQNWFLVSRRGGIAGTPPVRRNYAARPRGVAKNKQGPDAALCP